MGKWPIAFAGRVSVAVVIITCMTNCIHSQVLNRFENILNWAAEEEVIYGLAKARISRLKLELRELELFAKDYEESTERHLSGIKDELFAEVVREDSNVRTRVIASNPLLIQRMSQRAAINVPKIMKTVLGEDPDGDKLREVLSQFMDPATAPTEGWITPVFGKFHEYLPGEVDRVESIQSLAMLYDVFDRFVSPFTFASQLSDDTALPVNIDAKLASMISMKALEHGMYGNAIDWIVYAETRVNNSYEPGGDDSIPRDLVRYIREFMSNTHNEEHSSGVDSFTTPSTYLNFFTAPVGEEIVTNRQGWTKRRVAVQDELEGQVVATPSPELERLDTSYYSLCHGFQLKSPREQRKLRCYLDPSQHPTFLLAPLKVEQLSKSPRILQFHEILSDSEIQSALEAFQSTRMQPQFTWAFPDEEGTREPPARTGAQASLGIHKTKQLMRIAKKVQLITGLRVFGTDNDHVSANKRQDQQKNGTTESQKKKADKMNQGTQAEYFRLTEYVAGRCAMLHAEADPDIMASLQFYMNYVEHGGATPFPVAGTFAVPTRGSALYWESLNTDGTHRPDVWHGECPVLLGQKITLTKHFHRSKQAPYLRCPLRQLTQ